MCESRAGNGRYLTLGQRGDFPALYPSILEEEEVNPRTRSVKKTVRHVFFDSPFSLSFSLSLAFVSSRMVVSSSESSERSRGVKQRRVPSRNLQTTREPRGFRYRTVLFSSSLHRIHTLLVSWEKYLKFCSLSFENVFFFFVKREIRNVFNFKL